jgi:DNA-binding NtrC family response regulator
MDSVNTAVNRLPIVLVVDPVAASRFAMWRLLSSSVGVLEAPDARGARGWLACRQDIDALVVQRTLADADGNAFVKSLATVPVALRAIVIARPVDFRAVVMSLSGWLFSRDARGPEVLPRAADRLVS